MEERLDSCLDDLFNLFPYVPGREVADIKDVPAAGEQELIHDLCSSEDTKLWFHVIPAVT